MLDATCTTQIQSHNRLPILQRAHPDMLPGFNLTQRDIAIVEAVYTYRALTTTQIETLFAAGETAIESGDVAYSSSVEDAVSSRFLFRDERRPKRLTDGRKPLVLPRSARCRVAGLAAWRVAEGDRLESKR